MTIRLGTLAIHGKEVKIRQENSLSQELQSKRLCELKSLDQERQSEAMQEPYLLGQERMERHRKDVIRYRERSEKGFFSNQDSM